MPQAQPKARPAPKPQPKIKDIPEAEWGSTIRAARMLKRLSQRDVEDLTGISQPVISHYELGNPAYKLTKERFDQIMAALQEAAARPEETGVPRGTKPSRLSLPPRMAARWEALSVTERSAIVRAGMEYLGH